MNGHAKFSYLLQNGSQYLCHPIDKPHILIQHCYMLNKINIKVSVAVHICIPYD